MTKDSIQYDCFRGCAITGEDSPEEMKVEYRPGCCKLGVRDWLKDAHDGSFKNIFEVRFKNTRKGYYINDSTHNIRLGDFVMTEASTGQDLGIVSLDGPTLGRQLAARGIDPATYEFKRIYRKARQSDLEKWREAISREQDTMIKARRIAAMMGLEMKIGDVEYQGDGSKAIFYYIADGRVDFRQLIKAYAEEFHIKIEMKQIGARQEAGLIGGLGICGRELCCANYVSSFQSISTTAARSQNLSLNPQKLAGQCGKLKCCLNYEVPNYLDAQTRIPKVVAPLEFQDGFAYLKKTDILREVLYFSYDKTSDANLHPLSAEEVSEIIQMNRRGEKPESIHEEARSASPEFISAVGDDSISRFDKPKRDKRNKNNRGQRNNRRDNRPSGSKKTSEQ